ncbi:MAG TPA: immunoglobulin domain-containing protein [Verrucomicrobiae bacterium]|nr:immunoglobulin domain-containing protein [Verrucomicrobiae bacterium]
MNVIASRHRTWAAPHPGFATIVRRTRTSAVLALGLALKLGVSTSGTFAAQVHEDWSVHQTAIGVEALAPDGAGNLYVAGYSYYSTSKWDFILTKYDAGGGQLWQRRFDGAADEDFANAVAVNGSHAVIAGSSIIEPSNRDFQILKYTSTGMLEWTARYDGPSRSSDSPVAVTMDADGNVIVAGNSTGLRSGSDLTVIKYSASGQQLWVFRYDGPGENQDTVAAMKADAQGNIYVAGTSDDIFARPGIVTLKLNASGQQVWAARQSARSDPWNFIARSLAVDSAGNVITVGTENSSYLTLKYTPEGSLTWLARYQAEEPAFMSAKDVRVDPANNVVTGGNLYGSGTNDVVLVKYSPDGRQLWASRISHPGGAYHFNAMDMDAEGNTYVTGAPHYDALTVKVDTTGNQVWSALYNSTGLFYDVGEVLQADASGNVFMAGRSIHFGESFISIVKYQQSSVSGPPVVTVSPQVQIVEPGTNVTFTASASGTAPLHYQWLFAGRPVAGATGPVLTLNAVQAVHRGDYSVLVSNTVATTVSPDARLTVLVKPAVSVEPASQLAFHGAHAGFSVRFEDTEPYSYSWHGTEPFTYQWLHGGAPVPGATNSTLRVFDLTATDAGEYSVRVSSPAGTVVSGTATLSLSNVVRPLGAIRYNGHPNRSDSEPLLRITASGEKVMVAPSDGFGTGTDVLIVKYGPDDGLLWSSRFNRDGAEPDVPTDVAFDGSENIYVAVTSGYYYEAQSIVVLKYSAGGERLWARAYRDLIPTDNHSTTLAVDFGGRVTVAAQSGGVPVVIRYDSDGTELWRHRGEIPSYQGMPAVVVDGTGNSYLGTTIGPDESAAFMLRKLDPLGSVVWTQTFDAGWAETFTALAVDAEGYLVGLGSAVIDSGFDAIVFRYSTEGARLWATNISSPLLEYQYLFPRSFAVDAAAQITVLASIENDDDDPRGTAVIRVTRDGEVKWVAAASELIVPKIARLAVDEAGNAYVTGWAYRPATGPDIVTLKFDASGTRLWGVPYAADESTSESGTAVVLDPMGDIIVSGFSTARTGEGSDLVLLRYQQEPTGAVRLNFERNATGEVRLLLPPGSGFVLEASGDLIHWSAASLDERQRLSQFTDPFSLPSPQRFYRITPAAGF